MMSSHKYLTYPCDLILYLPGTNIYDQQLFSNQLKADIFLTLRRTNSIFPLHSFRVKNHSGYLRSHMYQRNIIIEDNFKEEDLSKILSLFYGFQIRFDRTYLLPYYNILAFLEVDALVKVLHLDIHNNLSEYDIFVVLQLAYTYNISTLVDLCLKELLHHQFEQMQYNLFDLLRCSEDVFRIVISHHNQMRTEGKIKGFTWQQIQQIIKQYSYTNLLSTTKTATLLHSLVDQKQLFQEEKKRTSQVYSPTKLPRNQPNNITKASTARKMSESYVADQFNLKNPLTPVRNCTFFSHIFDNDNNKTEGNNSQKAFIKKVGKDQMKLGSDKAHNISIKINENNKLNQQPKGLKLTINPLNDVVRAVSRDIQEKFNHQNYPPKPTLNKFVTEPIISSQPSKNYLTVTINAPTSPKSTEKKSTFKVWQSQKKSNNKINTNIVKPIKQEMKKSLLGEQSIAQSRYLDFNFYKKKDLPPMRAKTPISMKQIKEIHQIKSMDNLDNGKFNSQFESTPNFSFADDKTINKKQQYPITNDITNDYMVEIKPMQIIKLQSKAKNKSPIRSRRNTSYFTSEKSIIPKKNTINKSQVLRQIQDLNAQSEKTKQSSKAMLEEINKIKEEFSIKQLINESYKENLNNIDKTLSKLEKDFKDTNNSISKLQNKTQSISSQINRYYQKQL